MRKTTISSLLSSLVALGVVSATLAFTGTTAPAAEAICPGGSNPDPNVLFCEDFEWTAQANYEATPADWQARGWDWGNNFSTNYGDSGLYCNWNPSAPPAGDIPTPFDPSFAGNCGVLFDIPANSQGTPWPGHPFPEWGGGSGPGAAIYYRHYVKYSTDWVWHSNGSKQAYLFSRTANGSGNIIYFAELVADGRGKTQLILYDTYTCGPAGRLSQNQGNDFAFTGANLGRWVLVEYMVRNNTPNQSNAEYKLWIDGVLRAHHTGFRLRGDDCSQWAGAGPITTGYNQVWVNSYLGGAEPITHPTQEVFFDNVVVSRAPIGPLGSVAVPLPPTALRIQ